MKQYLKNQLKLRGRIQVLRLFFLRRRSPSRRIQSDTGLVQKGADSLPKAILKRKKSSNYWIYVAPVALAVVLLLVLGGYYYYTY
ncbi:hypothetical protein NL676_027198 [Syzygium grande]|nr:hypothetical protein NL676_027198 [Syzygium grande]